MEDSRRRRSREENPLPVIMSPIIAEDKETRSLTCSIHLAINRASSTSSGLFLLANEYNSHGGIHRTNVFRSRAGDDAADEEPVQCINHRHLHPQFSF